MKGIFKIFGMGIETLADAKTQRGIAKSFLGRAPTSIRAAQSLILGGIFKIANHLKLNSYKLKTSFLSSCPRNDRRRGGRRFGRFARR